MHEDLSRRQVQGDMDENRDGRRVGCRARASWRHTASLLASVCGGGIVESFIQTFIKETHMSRVLTSCDWRCHTGVSRPALP